MNAYLAGCGRTCFHSRRAARRRARQIRGEGGPRLHGYRCTRCHHVHIGPPRSYTPHFRASYRGPIHVTQLPA